jgi:mitogen-activated protein kinase kinase kinase YODA
MQFRYECFPFICQQIAAVFKIGNSKELPPIPDYLSEHCRDFIRKCLQRDPSQRPTAVELLQHPFIQNGISLEKSVTPNHLEHLVAISCRTKPKVPAECYYSHLILQLKIAYLLKFKVMYLSSVNFICFCNYVHRKLIC